jgi:hypothetical protein
MGIIIFAALVIIIVNIFTTKELTDVLSETMFDNKTFYRTCLIPPIGLITYCIFIILILILSLVETIINIWK